MAIRKLVLSAYKVVVESGIGSSTAHSSELLGWCDDVDREVARLRAAGATVLVEPYDHIAGDRRAYVADPDGNTRALVAEN